MMKEQYILFFGLMFILSACSGNSISNQRGNGNEESESERTYYRLDQFVMGADLSYVNQILDHGGTYQDSGNVKNPYEIFSQHGANIVRLRLWKNPQWMKSFHKDENKMYSNLPDVAKSIQEAKTQGMAVDLDFHYADIWADTDTQKIPKAWQNITSLDVLKDSVYAYTKYVLKTLSEKELMPEFVQIGNEINCGLMYTDAAENFPSLNVCDDEENWANTGEVINSGIQAVRDVSANSAINTKIILHVAQPENVDWWFSNITSNGGVEDFDIIGFSYYSAYSDVSINSISEKVATFKRKFGKSVMIVETAYPWTLQSADNYANVLGPNALVDGYPASKVGQFSYMKSLTQQVISGGGSGIMYWEPAWITSNMKTRYGTGSAWENSTFFDFAGHVHSGINYMTYDYNF